MYRPTSAVAGAAAALLGFFLLWLFVLALIDRGSPHAKRTQWTYSQLAGRPRLQIALATALIALLFAACESRGVVNVISGSPEDAAQAFLTALSQGEGDYGWHLLQPELRNAVSQDAYRRAVQAAGVTPFRFEVLHVTRDEAYLAAPHVRIVFDGPVEEWPAGLDRIFRGEFTTEDGCSLFRGYFLVGKERFRWWVYGCCG